MSTPTLVTSFSTCFYSLHSCFLEESLAPVCTCEATPFQGSHFCSPCRASDPAWRLLTTSAQSGCFCLVPPPCPIPVFGTQKPWQRPPPIPLLPCKLCGFLFVQLQLSLLLPDSIARGLPQGGPSVVGLPPPLLPVALHFGGKGSHFAFSG